MARLTACCCGLPLTATSNFWSSCREGRSETWKPATFAKRCRSFMSRAGGSGCTRRIIGMFRSLKRRADASFASTMNISMILCVYASSSGTASVTLPSSS